MITYYTPNGGAWKGQKTLIGTRFSGVAWLQGAKKRQFDDSIGYLQFHEIRKMLSLQHHINTREDCHRYHFFVASPLGFVIK